MAQIIAIANNKGGCGKTTTAANLSAALRIRGRDVLMIDTDSQTNLTACFGIRTDNNNSTFEGLRNPRPPYVEPVRILDQANGAGVLDLLPAVPDLSAVELGLTAEADRLTRLTRFVDQYRDKYDCIVIDTPPAIGNITVSALYAADRVIIAVQPQYLAVQGLLTLRGVIDTLNANGANIGQTTALFTQYDRRKGLHRMTADQVQAAGLDCFNTKIRDNVAIGEAPAAGLDIFRYAPRSNGATDYAELCAEVLKRGPIRHTKHNYKH